MVAILSVGLVHILEEFILYGHEDAIKKLGRGVVWELSPAAWETSHAFFRSMSFYFLNQDGETFLRIFQPKFLF